MQQYLLAKSSILVDVPNQYTDAFTKLPADERSDANDHFREALHGGESEERESLFEDLHDSTFNRPIEVDDVGQPDLEDLRAAANAAIEAYNQFESEFGLMFSPIPAGDPPTCVRYVWDSESGAWIAVYNWGLVVEQGKDSGDHFNWLPLATAKERSGFALPPELSFLMSGQDVEVDFAYHIKVSIEAI